VFSGPHTDDCGDNGFAFALLRCPQSALCSPKDSAVSYRRNTNARFIIDFCASVFRFALSFGKKIYSLIYLPPARPALLVLWHLGAGLGLIAWDLMNPRGQK